MVIRVQTNIREIGLNLLRQTVMRTNPDERLTQSSPDDNPNDNFLVHSFTH